MENLHWRYYWEDYFCHVFWKIVQNFSFFDFLKFHANFNFKKQFQVVKYPADSKHLIGFIIGSHITVYTQPLLLKFHFVIPNYTV